MHALRAASSAAILATLVLACEGRPIDTLVTPPTDTPTLTRSVFLGGLSSPWDIAFHTDGAMFFTEKCRGLSVRLPDGTLHHLFGSAGASLVASDFFCEGQSGMHGVALDPLFVSNRRVYVFMPSNLNASPRTNRVVRVTLNEGYSAASERLDIVTDIAFKHVGNAHGGSGAHSGGRIRFGNDGYLYIGTGDNHSGTIPQSPTVLGGKVLRVTPFGQAAPGNNAPAGFDPRIYTFGHRNVQGIARRPSDGAMFVAEHGPNHSDEVTRLVAGGNAGWDPQNRPGLSCADGYCGYAGNATTMPMTDVTRFPTVLTPSWSNGGASQGMGPATFLNGEQWRAWDGRLAVGIMGGQRLMILTVSTAGATTDAVQATLTPARYRALTQGPDGNLYIAVDAGEIWRIVPSPGA